MRWKDGTPYAFQAWDQPVVENLEAYRYRLRYNRGNYEVGELYGSTSMQQRSLQPDPQHHCTAAVKSLSLGSGWIMIPCDHRHVSVAFICEKRTSRGQGGPGSTVRLLPNRTRSIMECPARSIKVSGLNHPCMTIRSVTKRDAIDQACLNLTGKLFELPEFLLSKHAFNWSESDIFVVNMLREMNHRWPVLMEYQPWQISDVVIFQAHGQNAAFQFSNTSLKLGHVEIRNVSDMRLFGGIHVACAVPLLLADTSCSSGHFMCADGTCVLSHYVCDGIPDCPDETDEYACQDVCSFRNINDNLNGETLGKGDCLIECFEKNCVCSELHFQCLLGGCVPWSRVCDGVDDCPHHEDEEGCLFYYKDNTEIISIIHKSGRLQLFPEKKADTSNDTYRCTDGKTLPRILINDLIPDCPSQSDEEDYYHFLKNGSRTIYSNNPLLCDAADETTCVKNFPGVCYSRHAFCVFETGVHCRNGGHLRHCKYHVCPSQFKCPSSYCIPTHSVCDGNLDCPAGEDETDCSRLSCPGYLLCRHDKICVHPDDVGRGHIRCRISEDDKALVDATECPVGCKCLGFAVSCQRRPNLEMIHTLPSAVRSLSIDNSAVSMHSLNLSDIGIRFLLHLKLTKCNLQTIGVNDLSSLMFLKSINLSYNGITTVKTNALHSLKNLQDLDFSNNKLTRLRPELFHGAQDLRQINFNYNQIEMIAPCTFKALSRLRVLLLANNKLTYLGKSIFCGERLEELDVSGNPFHVVDIPILTQSGQHLIMVNTSPIHLCCFIPNVKRCFPSSNPSNVSSCRNLLPSSALQILYWVGAVVLITVLCGVMLWFVWQIRFTHLGNKVHNQLSLSLFAFNFYFGIYFLAVASVDQVSSGYYSFFNQIWRNHPLCTVLNVLSYATFEVSQFICLLISCTRLIATLFPFQAESISRLGIIMSIIAWLGVVLVIGYFGHYIIRPENEAGLALGVVLPATSGVKSWWSSVVFIAPTVCIMLLASACQIITIHSLNKTNPKVYSHTMSSYKRRASRFSLVTLFATLLQHVPLLVAHLARERLPTFGLFLVTIVTLLLIPLGNVTMYVFISTDFRRLFLRNSSL